MTGSVFNIEVVGVSKEESKEIVKHIRQDWFEETYGGWDSRGDMDHLNLPERMSESGRDSLKFTHKTTNDEYFGCYHDEGFLVHYKVDYTEEMRTLKSKLSLLDELYEFLKSEYDYEVKYYNSTGTI